MSDSRVVAPSGEDQAEAIFRDIRGTLGLSEVPELFRVMARLPIYLETSWRRFRFAFVDAGRLDLRTRWMVGLAVSASNNNKPMIAQCTERLVAMGASEAEIAELMAVVDVSNGLNKAVKAAEALPRT